MDIIPCTLFKELITELLPSLYHIINTSLQTGHFPSVLKISSITPVLKAQNLAIDILNNFRPVNTIPLIPKIFEICVKTQLMEHLQINKLYTPHQSAYREHHSCETAIIKTIDDILQDFAADSFVIMTLLDFSAAFDTVDHNILIDKLEKRFGITETALSWFKSYLNDRTYKVKINNAFSSSQTLKYGVPQGSILGPILYSLNVAEIEDIAKYYKINIHVYADDVILYAKNSQLSNLNECLNQVKKWASKNYLKLNDNKTQLICLSPKNNKLDKPITINLMGEDIKVEKTAKYLGVWLDDNLNMIKQINNVCAQGYVMLKNLWKISSKVSDIQLRTQLIHSCVLSKLNFCSAVYNSLPKKHLYKLDKLLKAAARFIFRICGIERWSPMTPYLQELHFLPIAYRSEFKINLLVYKCFHNQAPEYLKSLIIPRINESIRETRKDKDKTWLNKYPIEKFNYKCRSFRQIAPDVWNKLNINVRDSPSIEIFKTRLKTFYFQQWLEECS